MVGSVINCRRCNKIFQKVVNSDHCPTCVRQEEENISLLYRRLQKSASQGGLFIEDLAAEFQIPVDEIERYYMEGKLTTGVMYLKTACQGCGAIIREIERKGRFCMNCSEDTATKAGVEVKYIHTLQKEEEQEKRRQEQLQLLKKNKPTTKEAPRKFGFVRTEHF